MEDVKLIEVESTDSTNNYAKGLEKETDSRGVPRPIVVWAKEQTAGRGQRGNSWESEPGKNLTFSLVLYPQWLSAKHQFELSMLVSLGITAGLHKYLNTFEDLRIKWPNDIYYKDKKLAGILIENSIKENRIERSVVGVGLNVNQENFVSDAPNPISLREILGRELDLKEVLESVVSQILELLRIYADDSEPDELEAVYNAMLWRNDDEYHKWELPDGSIFEAELKRVDIDGKLYLEEKGGETKGYLFKEISAVL